MCCTVASSLYNEICCAMEKPSTRSLLGALRSRSTAKTAKQMLQWPLIGSQLQAGQLAAGASAHHRQSAHPVLFSTLLVFTSFSSFAQLQHNSLLSFADLHCALNDATHVVTLDTQSHTTEHRLRLLPPAGSSILQQSSIEPP